MPTAIPAEALCFSKMRRLRDGCLDRKKSKRGEYFKYDRKKIALKTWKLMILRGKRLFFWLLPVEAD